MTAPQESGLRRAVKRARGRGASLLAVVTADQPAAASEIAAACNGAAACVSWDAVRGPLALNRAGEGAVAAICAAGGGLEPSAITDWPMMSLLAGAALPKEAALVVYNAHRLMDDLRCVQGALNLRDAFGADSRTVVLLCTTWPAPAELGSDVLVITDELPDEDERAAMARAVLKAAIDGGATVADVDGTVQEAVGMLRGLSRYAAQQTLSLSMERTGLSREQLQARWVAAVNATPGLTFETEIVEGADIGGLASFREEAELIKNGRNAPAAVIFIDEIEKALSGSTGARSGGDSGVSSRILGELLSFMEDTGADGLVACGPAGSGKSMSAKALGRILGIPTVRLNVGALMAGLVGASEQNTRKMLATISALAPRTYWIATCNSLRDDAVPPELIRRFTAGVWMFDLPDANERCEIWGVWRRKFEIAASDVTPDDRGWSGANIRNCCKRAWRYNTTLAVAARRIIPAAVQCRAQIEALRRAAVGNWLSASKPGAYEVPAPEVAPVAARAIKFDA